MLSQDSLPVLARRLFAQLVKVTKGEASYGESDIFTQPHRKKNWLCLTRSMPPSTALLKRINQCSWAKKSLSLRSALFVVAQEQVEQLTAALASGQFPVGPNEKPPINAMINLTPQAPSLSASSSYPQVAAAIANGEPKALNPPINPEGSFPISQSEAEQAETFPKLPAPDMAPALAPARTFVAQPAQLSSDEEIAALIFPEPPSEMPEPLPAASDLAIEPPAPILQDVAPPPAGQADLPLSAFSA